MNKGRRRCREILICALRKGEEKELRNYPKAGIFISALRMANLMLGRCTRKLAAQRKMNNNAIGFIEKNFKIISKAKGDTISQLIPMKLWRNQRHFIENQTKRNAILKGRQLGVSCGVEAGNSAILFTIPYQRQTIITHDAETSGFLFENVQRFYRNLPWNQNLSEDLMQPRHDWKSGTRMRFPIIDSYIYIDSAKSDSIGVGHTLNNAHLSEVAKWPQKKGRQLFADITQTVPMDGCITAESTPQGRVGLWCEIYHDAKKGTNGFTPFFYPWWWNDDYITDPNIYLTNEKAEIIAEILGQSTANFLKDEKAFAEYNKLSPSQLAFRRMKIGEIKLLYFQEYPEDDVNCWLSNETSVMDEASLRPYFAEIKSGREEGNSTIWKDVLGGESYVIGVDVASGTARDYSVASVLRSRNLEYVARIRGKIHTDLFAEQLFQLGLRYNNALVAVERIGHGHSVLRVLLEKNYPNLYYHTDYDEMVKQNVTDAGWKTSVKTKLPMVNTMIRAFRTRDLISYSENLLTEASGLTWKGQIDTQVETSAGGNDDEWDAVSIALQVRESMPLGNFEEKRAPIIRYARVI